MTNWHLLPGLGATAAMYNSLKRKIAFPVNFIDWPSYQGEKSYSDVARRVIEDYGIVDGDVIGGSSLGGMVSLEMAKVMTPRAVVLLGSAMHSAEVQRLLRLISPLAEITPIKFLQIAAGKFSPFLSMAFSHTDIDFIRSMGLFLPHWSGYSGPTDAVYRLHGRKDHIIPCPAAGSEVIEDAGHFLAITHAKETAEFLQKTRERIEAVATASPCT